MGGEDPLEEEMATLSSILAWEIPWTEESDRSQKRRTPLRDLARTQNKNNSASFIGLARATDNAREMLNT